MRTPHLQRGTGNEAGNAVSWNDLIPGTSYTLTETTQTGFDGGVLACVDGAGAAITDTNGADNIVTFEAPLGDDNDPSVTYEVNCAITNTALPSDLEVTKTVETNAAAGWSFAFDLTPSATVGEASPATGTGAGSDTVTWTGLIPGTSYTLAETESTGYTGGALTCNVSDTDGDLTDLSVTFVAPLGDANDPSVTFEVTCAITNQQWPDLLVEKTVDPAAVADGGGLVFTIEVSNLGILPATAVVLTDVLPVGLDYDSHVASAGTSFDSGTGIWTVGTINGGASATLTITVLMDAADAQCADEYTNTVSVTSQGETDFDPGNHSDSATANLVAIAVAKALVGQPTAVTDGELGDSFLVTYDLLVVNTGGVTLNSVRVEDNLVDLIDTPNDNDATIDATLVMVTSPDMSLTPNPGYDGRTDFNLLDGSDSLLPGGEGKIRLTFELKPDVYFGPFYNQATAVGTSGGGVTVSDLSEDGTSVTTTFDNNRIYDVVTFAEGCVVDSPTNFILEIPTTPVTLGWFKASDQGGGSVLFEWNTESEVANAGFKLQAQSDDGSWTTLNDAIIGSQGDSTAVQAYSYQSDTNAQLFRLVDISISGERKAHGDFKLGEAEGIQSPRKITDWSEINQESDDKQQQRDNEIRQELQRMLDSGGSSGAGVETDASPTSGIAARVSSFAGKLVGIALSSFIAPAHAMDIAKLEISQAGIYQISYEDMLSAGVDLSGQSLDQIGVKVYGKHIPVKLVGNGSTNFAAGSYLRFAADVWPNPYSVHSTYTVSVGEGQALIQTDSKAVPTGKAATNYMAERSYAPQNIYSHTSPSLEDSWYADSLKAISGAASKQVSIEVDGYFPVIARTSTGGGAVQQADEKPSLKLKLWGASSLQGDGVNNPDHHVTADLNGENVSDVRFDGLQQEIVVQSLSDIQNGSNQVTVRLPNDHGYAFDLVNLDEVTLRYPRRFYAEQNGNSLVFNSAWPKFRVRHLASDNIEVYRRSGNGAVFELTERELKGCAAGAGSCIVAFAGDDQGLSQYFVATDSGISKPSISLLAAPQELFNGNAGYLVIAHNDFMGNSNLQEYVSELATSHGSADLVDVQSIYATYSGHETNAQAIHAYIKDARDSRDTQHVLLVGGDIYDYQNNLGTNARSFVPSLYVQIAQNVNAVPSDAKYADMDDDNIPDIGISRLPVRSTGELNRILEKRAQYMVRDYADTAVFAADKVDGSGYAFKEDAQAAINSSFGTWQVGETYMDDQELAAAKSSLIQQINAGSAITSYFGHSSTDRWSVSGLLTGDEVANLSNTNKPTVVAQWGCWNTFYVSPTEDSIATRFLVENSQGAVTVMGASSLTSAEAEREMSLILYRHLNLGKSISQAVLDAKRELAIERPYQLDVLLGWAVLGVADISVN